MVNASVRVENGTFECAHEAKFQESYAGYFMPTLLLVPDWFIDSLSDYCDKK